MRNSQNAINFILLIIIIVCCNSSTNRFQSWTPESLYKYAKDEYQKKYMIIDPENYLINEDISLLKEKLRFIYKKFNIHTYIIFISYLDSSRYNQNIDINEQVQRFASTFNYLLSKDDSHYNDSMSLTTVFFIKQRKMRMRTGKLVKNTITDDDALKILNNRKDELRNEKYYKVAYDLIDDIYSTYEYNLVYHESFWYKHSGKITTILCIILGLLFILYNYLTHVPESQREKKIKEFLDKNKNKQIKNIFNESCIICLDNFKEEEQNNNDNKENKETQKKEGEKEEEKTTVLECGHKFHDNCIINWLKKNNNCPICRINLNLENNQNQSSDYQNNILLGNDNFVGNLIEIQEDAYGDDINGTQRSRIFSRCRDNTCSDDTCSKDYGCSDNWDNDNDSGGATSDW